MNNLSELCLSGYGYLEEVTQKDKIVARIGWTPKHHQSLEEIILDCEIDNLLLMSLIDPLHQALQAQHEIKLYFMAEYCGFGSYFSGLTPEDPQHMLRLQCRLKSVGFWYCDDVLMPFDRESLRSLHRSVIQNYYLPQEVL